MSAGGASHLIKVFSEIASPEGDKRGSQVVSPAGLFLGAPWIPGPDDPGIRCFGLGPKRDGLVVPGSVGTGYVNQVLTHIG